ncbi:MAG: ATP-binding protein, partial [Candidatus Dormiibacterota bacterium]
NAAYDGFARRPDQARDALRTIAGSGRAALNDLRRLLEVVHPEVEDDPLRPQPGLSDLEQLAAAVRSAGLAVAVHHDGTPPTVPAVIDLSAYRIVQEALTNALRHASASHAEVAVRYSPDALELEITDDGRGAAGHDEWMEGRGLTGMRERAALLRGTVDAEPLAQGGWRVHAWLPLERAR